MVHVFHTERDVFHPLFENCVWISLEIIFIGKRERAWHIFLLSTIQHLHTEYTLYHSQHCWKQAFTFTSLQSFLGTKEMINSTSFFYFMSVFFFFFFQINACSVLDKCQVPPVGMTYNIFPQAGFTNSAIHLISLHQPKDSKINNFFNKIALNNWNEIPNIAFSEQVCVHTYVCTMTQFHISANDY